MNSIVEPRADALRQPEPARRPAHQENLTDFRGALESAPKGARIPVAILVRLGVQSWPEALDGLSRCVGGSFLRDRPELAVAGDAARRRRRRRVTEGRSAPACAQPGEGGTVAAPERGCPPGPTEAAVGPAAAAPGGREGWPGPECLVPITRSVMGTSLSPQSAWRRLRTHCPIDTTHRMPTSPSLHAGER